MRNKTIIIFSLILCPFLLLAGCEEELSNEEIYANMIEAVDEANSYRFTMSIDQTMNMPDMPLININMLSSGEAIDDPLAVYMEMSMTSEDMTMEMTSYMVDDLMYMYISELGWVFMDMSEELDLVDNMMATEYIDILDNLEPDQINFSLSDGSYILELDDADGTFMDQMMEDYMAQGGMDMFGMDDLAMFMSNFEFSNIWYKLTLDAKTFLPSSVEMSMTTDLTMMGESVSMEQVSVIRMTDYNKISSIVVPQEVIDQATSIEELYEY